MTTYEIVSAELKGNVDGDFFSGANNKRKENIISEVYLPTLRGIFDSAFHLFAY